MCHPSAEDLELHYLRRLLACLVFELQDLEVGEQLYDNDVICIRTLIHQAPKSVMELVKYLHDHPDDREDDKTYTYAFPFMQWWKPGGAPPEAYLIPPCRQTLTGQRDTPHPEKKKRAPAEE
jgi:hypothetical protein